VLSRLFFAIIGRDAVHVVLCESMRERCNFLYPARTTVVLSNRRLMQSAVPINEEPSARRPAGAPIERIGMLGNLTVEKGVGLAIALLSQLHDSGRIVHLVLAGPIDAEARLMVDRAIDAGLEIQVVGSVYSFEKGRFLRSLDVLVFPSIYVNEADPLVVWESLAEGTPVLATRRGCLQADTPGMRVFPEESFVTEAFKAISRGKLPEVVAGQSIDDPDGEDEMLQLFAALGAVSDGQ